MYAVITRAVIVNLHISVTLALPILPSHVSAQRLRITFLLHMALYEFFILYCIVTNVHQLVKCTTHFGNCAVHLMK